jgi:hypothetical protein
MIKNDFFSDDDREVALAVVDLLMAYDVIGKPDAADDAPMTVRKIMRQLFPEINVRVTRGAYRMAIIFSHFVVKVPYASDAISATFIEAEYIGDRLRDPLLAPFFPQTELLIRVATPVLLQEKIDSVGTGDSRPHLFPVSLAYMLGIGFDMHANNFGFRKIGGKKYPVYVDCDTQYERTPSY